MAARMVDAQAPGLARRLRGLAQLPTAGDGWSARWLAQLGQLALLLDAFKRSDQLPASVQADLRAAIGWTFKAEDVAEQGGVQDCWQVLGQHSHDEEQLRVRRTWLWGQHTGAPALLLDFAHQKQPWATMFAPEQCMHGEVVFYPSHAPLRALLRQHQPGTPPPTSPFGYPSIDAWLENSVQYWARNPWQDTLPAPLDAIVPVQHPSGWYVRDTAGALLPIAPHFEQSWQLLALSGGHPLWLFAEWDGQTLLPLAAWSGGTWWNLD